MQITKKKQFYLFIFLFNFFCLPQNF
jgi:hypothetical protein